jgi:DHA1 family inner membrane transport protein
MSRMLPIVCASGNFVVGLGVFVMIGLNTPIAAAYHTTPDAAGMVVTWYAVAYALAAPISTALTGRTSRQNALAGGLVLFAVASAAGALAPNLFILKASRILAAVGAGIFNPAAAAVVASTAAHERRGRALAILFSGTTVAQVFGVPVGSWCGYAFGFSATLWVVSGLAVFAAVIVWVSIPAKLDFKPTSLETLAHTLLMPHLVLAALYSTTLMAATYAVYTYIGPLIESRYGFGRDGVTFYLVLMGIVAIPSNFLGGHLADRLGTSRTLMALNALQIFMLPIVAWAQIGPVAMAIAISIWGMSAWAYMTPQQSRLVGLAPDYPGIMMSLNTSAIFIGVAIGSALGGAALARGNWGLVAGLSCILAVGALVHLIVSNRVANRLGGPTKLRRT